MPALFTHSALDAIYLVELGVQPPTTGDTSGETDFGDRPFAVEERNDFIENVEAMYRWADKPYRSRPEDDPPNTEWEHRLLTPLELRRVLPLVPGGEQSGIISADLGKIVLLNTDKALDALVRSFSVDGRDVTVKKVQPGAPYSSAVTMFTGTAEGWAFAGRNAVELTIRGRAHRLDGPLQNNIYAGTGGNDGGPDIASRPKPLCYGYCENVTPVQVNADIQLWQVHDGPHQGLPGVFDGQVPLEQGADYPTLEELNDEDNDPAGGFYTTCLALGYFRLGARPEYQITCTVEGDKTDGVYVTAAAHIARRLMLRAGINPAHLDNAGIAALAVLQPAETCYHVPATPVNAAASVAEVLAGIGAFLIETPAGLYTMERLEAPAPSADFIGPDAYEELAIVELPVELRPVIWRIGVTYALNWTVQQIQIDAVNAPLERLEFVRQASRIGIAFDTDIKTIYRMARDHVADMPPVLGFFRYKADAEAEAARLLALWGVPRQALAVAVSANGFDIEIGASLELVASRYGMEEGAPCRVYGTTFRAASSELLLNLLR